MGGKKQRRKEGSEGERRMKPSCSILLKRGMGTKLTGKREVPN